MTSSEPWEIVPFRDEHAEAFYALNRAWLDEHGLFEPVDEAQLVDPTGSILAIGGAIFVALDGDAVIGTAAVIPHGPGELPTGVMRPWESWSRPQAPPSSSTPLTCASG